MGQSGTPYYISRARKKEGKAGTGRQEIRREGRKGERRRCIREGKYKEEKKKEMKGKGKGENI